MSVIAPIGTRDDRRQAGLELAAKIKGMSATEAKEYARQRNAENAENARKRAAGGTASGQRATARTSDEEFEVTVGKFLKKGLITEKEAEELLGKPVAQQTLDVFSVYARRNKSPEERRIIDAELAKLSQKDSCAKPATPKQPAAKSKIDTTAIYAARNRPRSQEDSKAATTPADQPRTFEALAARVYGAAPASTRNVIGTSVRGGGK
jgi:hypothetical protein